MNYLKKYTIIYFSIKMLNGISRKAVINLSIFNIFSRKFSNKKRDLYCEDAKIFIQVHYIRERGNEKYAFNTLTLKTDIERDKCDEWYASHGNPDNFMDIVKLYLNEKKINTMDICSEYGLDTKIFSHTSTTACPVEKWEAAAICLGLNLNIYETRTLLKTVGYALTNSSESDLIIRYCIENELYSAEDINYILSKICGRRLNEVN